MKRERLAFVLLFFLFGNEEFLFWTLLFSDDEDINVP